MAGLMVDITAKINNFRAILPRATAKEVAECFMFAAVKTKAGEHGLLSREIRIGAQKWLIIEGQWYVLPEVGPCSPVRVLVDQNGENVVSTFFRLFLTRSFLYLQIMRTCKSWMSSNFGQIGPLTMELAALECLKNFPYT